MPLIHLETFVAAPIERVFDLSRDIDLHKQSTSMRIIDAIGGRTAGLIGKDETVTWRARHFGVVWKHTSVISGYDRPWFFRDEMVRGVFARLEHDHLFSEQDGGTLMIDHFFFAVRFGPLGRLIEGTVLRRYMTALLEARAEDIRRAAEG
jgi:ligand-binding SRPBCC domain-containing protein